MKEVKMRDTFDKAIALLKKGWTKGAMARDMKGRSTFQGGSDAVCWCAIGAIAAASGSDVEGYTRTMREVAVLVPDQWVAKWNDNCQSVDEVIAVFEKARDM